MVQSPEARAVPVLPVADVLAPGGAPVVDLRSPAEFAADHLPGARNVHLFDDAGRALVGFLYTQRSPEQAFERGRELVGARVEELVAEIGRAIDWAPPDVDLEALVRAMTEGGIGGMERDLQAASVAGADADVVLHCWRGGLRSRSVVALLRRLGLNAVGLEGGYKAYRARVLEELADFQAPPCFALRGLTGVGKTLVLRAIAARRPGWVLDLEGCAGHRSSLLGMVGLEPVSQKTFDSRLASRVRAGFDGCVVMEGESRKVGDVVIPGSIWGALQGATNVLLTAPTEVRVKVLMDDYLADPSARGLLREQLSAVAERMGGVDLAAMLDAGQEAELTQVLLERYYDPLYRHSETGKSYAFEVGTSDPEAAADAIVDWIEDRR